MSDAAYARIGNITFLFDQSTGDLIGVVRKDGSVRRLVQASVIDNFQTGPAPYKNLSILPPDATVSVDLAHVSDMSANARSFCAAADYTAMRVALGVVVGTDVEAYDADLVALAALATAADKVSYWTGSGAAALASFTAAGRSMAGAADAQAQAALLPYGAVIAVAVSRALAATDNGALLVCAAGVTLTANAGLGAKFGCGVVGSAGQVTVAAGTASIDNKDGHTKTEKAKAVANLIMWGADQLLFAGATGA